MLSGYDAGLINLVLVMDSFLIFFRFHTWDGSALDEKGKFTTGDDKWYRNLEETSEKATLEGLITSSFVLGALCGAIAATYLGESLVVKELFLLELAFILLVLLSKVHLHVIGL